MNVMTSSA